METITLIVIGIVATFGAFMMAPSTDQSYLNVTIPSSIETPSPPVPLKDNHRPVFGEQMAKAQEKIETQNISVASGSAEEFIESLNMSRQELLEMLDYEFMYQGLKPIKTVGITFEDEFNTRDLLTLNGGRITNVQENSFEPAEYEMSFTRQGIQTCLDMRKSFSTTRLQDCMSSMHTNQTDVFNDIIERGCIANFGTAFICQPFMR